MKDLQKNEIIAGLAAILLLMIVAILLMIDKFGNKKIDQVQEPVMVVEQTEEVVEEPAVEEAPDEIVSYEDIIVDNDVASMPKVEKKANVSRVEDVYIPQRLKVIKNSDTQMAELLAYWRAYDLNAINDLVRLDRIRAVSKELKGTNDFYYFGSTDGDNKPDGEGVAIYSDDTYYFGDWKDGVRSGNGMWLRLYLDKAGTVDGYTGVLEHFYTGSWLNDLPNGEGQEHFTYDYELMTNTKSIANVIGSFQDGYYNGEVLIMYAHTDGSTDDWYATAKRGEFVYLKDELSSFGAKAVFSKGPNGNDMGVDLGYLVVEDNVGWGIASLKK